MKILSFFVLFYSCICFSQVGPPDYKKSATFTGAVNQPNDTLIGTLASGNKLFGYKKESEIKGYIPNIIGIPKDFFIANTLYKYIIEPSTYDGRSMYYTYKGQEKYFDITPYVPSRSVFPRLLTDQVFLNGNDIIINGITGYNSSDNADVFLLVLKNCYLKDGVLKVGSYTYKTFVNMLERQSDGTMYRVHGAAFFNGYLYGNTRINPAGIAENSRTQVFKINPYDLNDFKVIRLDAYAGNCGEIQVTPDGVFSVVALGSTSGAFLVRTDLNLENVTSIANLGTVTAERLGNYGTPFTIFEGEVYVPTYPNTNPSAYTTIGISVYNSVSGKLVRKSLPLVYSNGANSVTGQPHWMNIYQGKLLIHTCTGNPNRYIIRIDAKTLTLEDSKPVEYFSGTPNTKFGPHASIMSDGNIYFTEELNATDGKLIVIKYNDFTKFTVVTPTGNGGYFYAAGAVDTRFNQDYKNTTLQQVLTSNNTANENINLVNPTTTSATNISPGGAQFSYNSALGILDYSGLTLKTNPVGFQGKISSDYLTTSAKGYQLPNTSITGATFVTSMSINGATPVFAGTDGNINFNLSTGDPATFTATLPIRFTGSDINGVFDSTPTASSVNFVNSGNLFTSFSLKANLASPAFTGVPTSTTASAGNNTTQIATTAFVAALGALKANLASPTFTGDAKAVTATAGDNDTSVATTAFVTAANNAMFTTNATTVGLSSATLNSTYPNVPVGYRVICGAIIMGGAIYTKYSENGTSDVWLISSTPVQM